MSSAPETAETSPNPRTRGPARADLMASVVVALVALPLCLGIALASGAPLLSGLVAGVIGGVLVGALSPSHVQVTGPAAGLTAVMIAAIATQGSYERVLPAVMIGGLLQLILGGFRTGFLARFVPTNVILGMLTAIGGILILKQLPHLVGGDADAMGDESFLQPDHENTFSELIQAAEHIHPGATLVGLLSLGLLVAWPKLPWPAVRAVPGPLAVVVFGGLLSALLSLVGAPLLIEESHRVAIPAGGPAALLSMLPRPEWSAFTSPSTWSVGLTLGLVASLETLLSLEASVKIDPQRRLANPDRELLAQGAGNLLSGFLGGLPLTGVVVRTSANIDAGGQTRWSAMIHGLLLLVATLALGAVINQIPLSTLAAVLLLVGWKLCSPAVFRKMWARGRSQFLPFAITAGSILLTDLLTGVLVGLAASAGMLLRDVLRSEALRPAGPPSAIITRLQLVEHVSFLHRASLLRALDELEPTQRVEIDGSACLRLDPDVLESIYDYAEGRGPHQVRLVNLPPRPAAGGH